MNDVRRLVEFLRQVILGTKWVEGRLSRVDTGK